MPEKTKRPASQYYWGDWRRDAALQSCSIGARGLWHEMNCIMHDSNPYGHLCVNSVPISIEKLARMTGISKRMCANLMSELHVAGVYSLAENGAIFSRRMVKDERLREIRADAGSLGGNPNLVNQKVNHSAKQNPTPASASSTASSTTKPKVKNTREALFDFPLPDFLNRDKWRLWMETRKGAVMTKNQAQAQVDKLVLWQQQGIDANEALENSADAGWQGLFKPKLPMQASMAGNGVETAYQRSMREKMESISPGIAAKNPNLKIEPEAIHGIALRLD